MPGVIRMAAGRERTERRLLHQHLRSPLRRGQDRSHLDGYGDQPSCHVAGTGQDDTTRESERGMEERLLPRIQEEIARRYAILRREMESDGAGRELVTVRGSQVDQWVEKHVTFSDSRPKLSKPTGSSQSAYRHGRQDGARQAIGLKETGKAADWALEK